MSITPTPDPRTWVDGDSITANLLNAELRDVLAFLTTGCQTTVTRSANQTIPAGTRTAITWDTVSDDVDDLISIPSSTFTFTRSGQIAVRVKVAFTNSTAGAIRRIIAVYTPSGGSATDVSATADGASAQYAQMALSFEIPVNPGDTLTLNVYQDSGASLDITAATSAVVRWVGKVDDWEDYDTPAPPPEPGDSTPPADTPTKHTATYWATWSRTYDGDNGTTWDDSDYCYQGYYSSARGNTRSLVGFDSAAIKSDLSGATNIKMTLTYHVTHSYYYAGMTVIIGGHSYSSKPATWSEANVTRNMQRKYSAEGKSYTVALNSDLVYGLRTGKFKGIAFGYGPTTSRGYYGYMSGAKMANKPKIIVTYYK